VRRAATQALSLMFAVTVTATSAATRSPALRAEFMRQHPCPATGATRGPCPGWHVDHIEALVCGGRDELGNLQWLPVAEHREKTRVEVKLCRSR
jgi:hypothetical protein